MLRNETKLGARFGSEEKEILNFTCNTIHKYLMSLN